MDDTPPAVPERPYRAFGFEFTVTGDLAGRLAPTFASFACPRGGHASVGTDGASSESSVVELNRVADEQYELVIDGAASFRSRDLGALVHQTVWEITRRAVASRSTDVVLHAAVVRIDSTLVAVSGVSGAGKSTLAASLLDRGASYLTDEAAVIDEAGRIVDAVRRPIHLSRESLRLLGSSEPPTVPMPGGGGYLAVPTPLVDLGEPNDAGEDSAERSVIVLLDQQEGELSVTSPRAAHVVARLVRDGFNDTARGTPGLERIKNAARRSVLIAISGGSITDRANAVLEIARNA